MSQRVCPAVSGAGGATGMIGQGLLRECLLDERIARMARIETVGRRKTVTVGRRKTVAAHAKITEAERADLGRAMIELLSGGTPEDPRIKGYNAAAV